MADNRSWSLSPDASKGGRPSSVKALRTAEQYPWITSASVRSSVCLSIARMPRTFFFNSFLAFRSFS